MRRRMILVHGESQYPGRHSEQPDLGLGDCDVWHVEGTMVGSVVVLNAAPAGDCA